MPYDSLGREIGGNVADLAKDMLGPVTRKPYKQEGGEKAEKKVGDSLKEFLGIFQPAMDSLRQMVKEVTSGYEQIRQAQQNKTKDGLTQKSMGKALKDQSSTFGDNFVMLDKLAQAGLKKGSIQTHDFYTGIINRKISNQNSIMIQLLVSMNNHLKQMAKVDVDVEDLFNVESRDQHGNITTKSMTSSGILVADKEDQTNAGLYQKLRMREQRFGKKDIQARLDDLKLDFMTDPITTLHEQSNKVARGIMAGQGKEGTSPMSQGLFGGLDAIIHDLGKSNLYQRNIAEVAYTTEGITLNMKKQQSIFRANRELTDIAISSGQDQFKTQDQYLKLLRGGYKTQKDTLKITRVSAHLSTMIGSNFEQTADFANDLHMSLGLSSDSVRDIARGMKQTARSSRLSGDAMLAAAHNAKPYLQALANAGTLTSGTAKNFISMQASMQKFGVGSNFQELMSAMTSPTAAMNANFETQSLMAAMASPGEGMGAFMMGKMNNPKEMAKGMQRLNNQIRMEMGVSLDQLQAMDEDVRANFLNMHPEIDLTLNAHYGKGVGELLKMQQAIQEGAKTFDMKLGDINKQLLDASTTDQERVKLMKQQDDLLQDQRDMLSEKSAAALSKSGSLSEAFAKMRGNKGTREALEESTRGGVFGKDFKVSDLNTDAGMQAALRKSFIDAAAKNNAVLGKSTSLMDKKFMMKNAAGKFDQAIASGDPKELARLQKELMEASDAAGAAQMEATDPARDAARGIDALNKEFAKYAAESVMYLKLIAGAGLIQGTGLVSLITRALTPFNLDKEKMGAALAGIEKTFGNGKLGNFVRGVMGKPTLNTGNFPLSMGGKAKAGQSIVAPGLLETAVSNIKNTGKGTGDLIKKGVFRFAEMQENLPRVGNLAKRFGAGKMIARNTMRGITGIDAAATAASPKLVASVAAKAAGPLMIFLAAMESVGQALETGAQAADIFGIAENQVSHAQTLAAQNAGFLTGVLNTLTFGIFSHWIGSTGEVTASLARFINSFQPLNIVLSALMVALKAAYGVFWGLLEAIWEIVKGIGGGVMNFLGALLEPISAVIDLFGDLFGVIGDILSPLGLIFGEFKEGMSWVDMIIGGIRSIGTVIGNFFRMVGILLPSGFMVLGKAIRVVSFLLTGFAKLLGFVLKPVIAVVSSVIGGFVDVVKILWKMLVGILTMDFAKLGEGFGDLLGVFGNRIKAVFGPLGGIIDAIGSAISSVWGIVTGFFGNVMTGLQQGFSAMWGEIVGGFWEGIGLVMEPIYEVWNEMKAVFWDAISPLMPLWDILKDMGAAIMDVFEPLGKVLKEFFNFGGDSSFVITALTTGLKALGHGLGFVLKVLGGLAGFVLKTLLLPLRAVVNLIGFMVKGFLLLATGDIAGFGKHLYNGIVAIFQALPMLFFKALAALGSTIVDTFVSVGETVFNTVVGFFTGLVNKVMSLIPGFNPLLAWWNGPRAPPPGAPGVPPIPGLAGGGLVKTPGMIYAGESGPEIVMPLEQFQDRIAQVMYGGDQQFANIAAGTAVSKPLTEVGARVQQDYASRGPAATTVVSAEMTAVASLTEKQITIMNMQLEELREIKDSLSQRGRLSGNVPPGSASTRSNTKPPNSPNYYDLAFGGFGDNASSGYINDGVT